MQVKIVIQDDFKIGNAVEVDPRIDEGPKPGQVKLNQAEGSEEPPSPKES